MMCRVPELSLVTGPGLGIVSHIHPALMRWWAESVITGLIRKEMDNITKS